VAQKAGAVEEDEAQRREIYKTGIDQVNKMNYILPIADLPLVMLHSKDVQILDDLTSPINTEVGDFAWTK
jgi:hypothetical protein